MEPTGGDGGGLAGDVEARVAVVLARVKSTAELWRCVADLGAPGARRTPIDHALHGALRAELARREAADEREIYEAAEEALVTGDLRPYWRAREIFLQSSPELTGRLFPLEPDADDPTPPADALLSADALGRMREVIRAKVASLANDAGATGGIRFALEAVEEAIARESEEFRAPLLYALAIERRRHARTERNMVRTRLALSLCDGRGYASFAEVQQRFADLPAEERALMFHRDDAPAPGT